MKRSSSTSNSKAYLFRYLRFALLLLLVTVGSSWLINRFHYYENQNWRVQDYMVADFASQPDNAFNTLFLGSSHMMCTMIPKVVESAIAAMHSFNLGASSQSPDTTYYLLKEALSRHKPKLVVMDLYYLVMATDHDFGQSAIIFRPLPTSATRIEMFSRLFTWDEQSLLIKTWFNPFYRIKSALVYNTEIALGVTDRVIDNSGTYMGRGFFSLGKRVIDTGLTWNTYTQKPETYKGLSKVQIGYVKKIAALSKEYHFKLLFITTPMSPFYRRMLNIYPAAAADVTALAKECGIDYIDYNKKENFSRTGIVDKDFADRYHFNQSGADKFSRFFAGELIRLRLDKLLK